MGLESTHSIGEQQSKREPPRAIVVPLENMVQALQTLPANNEPPTMRRVLQGLIKLDSEKTHVNAGPLDEAVVPDSKAEGLALMERVLEGLRKLDTGSSTAATPVATEAAASAAVESSSKPVLPTFEEKPLFPPDQTMVVSDTPPMRASKIVEAVIGSTRSHVPAGASEVTTVISDQPPAPVRIPHPEAPEVTQVIGDNAPTITPDQQPEPLPKLPYSDVGLQSGTWVLPEHSAVTDPIEDLPHADLPGPTDVPSILGSVRHQ